MGVAPSGSDRPVVRPSWPPDGWPSSRRERPSWPRPCGWTPPPWPVRPSSRSSWTTPPSWSVVAAGAVLRAVARAGAALVAAAVLRDVVALVAAAVVVVAAAFLPAAVRPVVDVAALLVAAALRAGADVLVAAVFDDAALLAAVLVVAAVLVAAVLVAAVLVAAVLRVGARPSWRRGPGGPGGSAAAGGGAGAGGGRLGQLARVGDHRAEGGAGLELRDRGLLDLHGLTGARVAAGAGCSGGLLERAEAGDTDLAAPGHLANDDVEHGLQGLRSSLPAAEAPFERVDQISLVHGFPLQRKQSPGPCPASGAVELAPDVRRR